MPPPDTSASPSQNQHAGGGEEVGGEDSKTHVLVWPSPQAIVTCVEGSPRSISASSTPPWSPATPVPSGSFSTPLTAAPESALAGAGAQSTTPAIAASKITRQRIRARTQEA
jgi:hypothetical protein